VNKMSVYAQDIIDLVPMKDAMELYGYEVSSKGFALCPFHNEKTASFKVYHNSFYCFGCGASGNVIHLVRKLYDLDFVEAVKRLNADFSLNLPIDERMTLRQARAYENKKREIEKARQRERERKQHIEDSYYSLLDEYIRLERNFNTYRPSVGDETLHPLFVEACRMLDYVSHKLDTFDWEGGSAA